MQTYSIMQQSGLPRQFSGKESACQCRRCGFYPCVGKIPWRRKWQSTLVFLPGKSHGERSLVGYSPWNHKNVRRDLATKQQQQNVTIKEMNQICKNEHLATHFTISEVGKQICKRTPTVFPAVYGVAKSQTQLGD